MYVWSVLGCVEDWYLGMGQFSTNNNTGGKYSSPGLHGGGGDWGLGPGFGP